LTIDVKKTPGYGFAFIGTCVTHQNHELLRLITPCFLKLPVDDAAKDFTRAIGTQAQDDLRTAEKLFNAHLTIANAQKNSLHHKVYADYLSKKGQYKDAARIYKVQNKGHAKKVTATGHPEELLERYSEVVKNGATQGIRRDDWLIMTGFPRSGTTLLENVLASHPDVFTIEESSSFQFAISRAFPDLSGRGEKSVEDTSARTEKVINWYFEDLDRRTTETTASVKIDKTPIQAAMVKVISQLLPLMRYIFSIRHPYDVVISCWQQNLSPNLWMSPFLNLQRACEFYHYVMSNWFAVFPGETDRVCYVYYDELVTNFEPTVRRVIDFLGVDWDDSVWNFAENSMKRAVRTPSYAKVGRGLSLGVQSSYQNYLFLFDDYCRSKLDPWVEFFGYTVE
jgi:hypothetical protein